MIRDILLQFVIFILIWKKLLLTVYKMIVLQFCGLILWLILRLFRLACCFCCLLFIFFSGS